MSNPRNIYREFFRPDATPAHETKIAQFASLVINFVVAIVFTALFRLARLPAGTDETAAAHYVADPDVPPAVPAPVTPAAAKSA